MINLPPARDAGASLLGHYGLQNPIVQWYLTRDPAFLAYTPTELANFSKSYASAPRCRQIVASFPAIGEPAAAGSCGEAMKWRYDAAGSPLWKCYRHDPPALRHIRPKKPVMDADGLKASIEELIRRTLKGETLDLVYAPEAGGWIIVEG